MAEPPRQEQGQKHRLSHIHRGEICLCSFDPTVGHEIKKTRPVLVIQNDIGNRYSPRPSSQRLPQASRKPHARSRSWSIPRHLTVWMFLLPFDSTKSEVWTGSGWCGVWACWMPGQ